MPITFVTESELSAAEFSRELEGEALVIPASVILVDAAPGEVVIVPPDQPHTFVNPGPGRLRQIDVHLSGRFVTRWLDDAPRP